MGKINIIINNPFRTDWQHTENAHFEIWVRASAFYGSQFINSFGLKNKLLEQLKINKEPLKQALLYFVNNLNGSFAVIVKHKDVLFAAVDHMRSIPLFYNQSLESIILSDDANSIRANLGDSKPDRHASIEFLLTGYVTGQETLFSEIKQMQAGEQLFFDGTLNIGPTAHPAKPEPDLRDRHATNEMLSLIELKLERVFKNFLDSIQERPVVIPLSDGFDSKLIVTMLAKLKAKNIICVTYSKPGTKILSVAKAIAGQAGFPWIFIPYNRKIWQDCIRSETTKHFVEIAHNIHTLPNLQDFPAVKYLSENNLIPTDSIFVPGHTAMMYLKGQPLRPGLGAVADAILAKHYCRWDWSLKYRQFHGLLYKKICSTMGNSFTAETLEEAILNFEKWELKERQPKFIVNAVRTYEYFGYEWRLPLWDKELVNFWLSIPLSARNGKKAIKKLLEQRGLEKSPSLQKKVSRRKNLRHYKEKIMQMPILFYLINKLDLRPSQVPRYWTNPLAFYGISSLKEYLFSYHYNLNAHSLLIKNLYENKYSAEFARSCTSFFTRNITNW